MRSDQKISTKTTVILATYNGENFIEQQIESIFSQNLLPAELIISDDGSNDRTMQIINILVSEVDPEFEVRIVLNERNLGFSDNFLTAASLAKTELVAFCDQDDVWSADKISKTEAAFSDSAIVLCVHPAATIDGQGSTLGTFAQGIHKRRTRGPLTYDPWGVFYGFSMTFRRSLLDLAPFEQRPVDYISGSGRVGHDRWIQFLTNVVGDTVELDENLIQYRQHGQNLFGASIRRAERPLDREAAIARGQLYAEAAHQFRATIDNFDPAVLASFPNYAGPAAARFWDRVADAELGRLALYDAPHRLGRLSQFISNIVHRRYRSASHGQFRLKAALKDGLIAAFG